MVLAAGRGQRMRPLSDVLPKPALPLPDGPLITWPMRLAAALEPELIAVNTWHLGKAMERALDLIDLGGVPVVTSKEAELMDTAGGLALARDRGLLGESGPVLVVNGDCVLRLDLEDLVARHAESDDLVTLALLPHLDPHAWSRLIVDHQGRVTEILPPGPPVNGEVPLLYPGVMVVSRNALNTLPTRVSSISEELWRPALEGGRLGGVVVSGHWREVGTPRSYLSAVLDMLGERPRVHSAARVHPDARLGVAMVGAGAAIEFGALVAESVIGAGVHIAPGARVIRSVLMGQVDTEEGETIVDQFRAVPR